MALEDLESTFDEMYDNKGVPQSLQSNCCEPCSYKYHFSTHGVLLKT
jgi:hypothetical protein